MKVDKTLTIYKRLPSSRPDKLMGCGVARRWLDKPVQQININIHDAYVIVVVLEGVGVFTDDQGQKHEMKEGMGFQRIPFQNHQFEIPKDQFYSEFFLHIPRQFYLEMREYGFAHEKNAVLYVEPLHLALNHVYLLADKINECHEMQLTSMLLELSSFAFDLLRKSKEIKTPSLHQKMIQEACFILGKNFQEHLYLPEMAKSFHLSYERFRKIFKEVMGVAPGDYRIRSRIQYAQNLLSDRNYNVNEIAMQLGYPDVFTFSKQFKKIVGCSPENFLKRLSGAKDNQ
jgi:AraC family transcriptional regulator of arabinose operon